MADVSVSVGAPSQISVTVAGSSGGSALVTNGSVATVTVTQAGDRGPKGDPGSVNLSDATPSALGTASAGTSSLASRADHTHPALTTFPYASLSGVPSTFAPATHTHTASQITDFATQAAKYGPVTSVNGQTGAVTVTTSGTYTLPTASDTVLGGVKVGTGLSITSGVLSATGGSSYTLPTASSTVLGGVRIGTGLTITSGVLSATGGGSFSGTVDGGDYTGTIVYDNTVTITQQPTGQSASGGAATFSVSAVSSPGGRLSYQWQRQVASDWVAVTGGTSASLALSGLTNGADNGVRYRVVVSSQSAASVTSNEAMLSVDATTPGVPTSVSAVRGDSTITLSWVAPASIGGSMLTDYVVQYSQNGGAWTTYSDGTSTATSVTLTGLPTVYYYGLRVAAVNGVGQGSFATLPGTVKNGPALLSGDTAGGGSLGASWTGVGDIGSALSLPFTYYATNSGGTAARITCLQSGVLNYSYTSTGATTGRTVQVTRNGTTISTTTDAVSFQAVNTGDQIVFSFNPAASGDRITITATLDT